MQPYYQDEHATIFHARCEDVLPTLGAASIDAVITDPPYGTTACAWDTPIPFDFMWRELKRVTKRNAAIVLFGSQPFTSALVMSNPGMFKYSWVWYKNNPTGFQIADIQPMRASEDLCVFYDGQCTYNRQPTKTRITDRRVMNGQKNGRAFEYKHEHVTGLRQAYEHPLNVDVSPWNVLEFPVVPRATGTLHPTQKPLALLEYLILTYTNPGDTVLDFTAGSGTTPAAAKKLGRKCIAIEQELEYVEIAATRLYQGVLDLQGV